MIKGSITLGFVAYFWVNLLIIQNMKLSSCDIKLLIYKQYNFSNPN